MATTQQALCPLCQRPLPQAGALCRYCGGHSPGSFHVRPLFLALVLLIAIAFCALTVFATRFYQSKQRQLGQMWFGRGQASLAAGYAPAAIQDFRNALYYSHDDPAYRLRLAEALAAGNHIAEAQSYLLTLWQDEPGNSTVNLQLARLAAREGKTQTALRYYHGAIYGFWTEGDAAARRQETRLELIHYLLGLRDATRADSELIALTPELPSKVGAHTEAGWLFMEAGDPDRALQEFQQALRLNPKVTSALRGAGEAAFQLAQYRSAYRYLDQALRTGPQDPQAAELLATARLILEWNPYAKGASLRVKALRIVQAFRQARRRLEECAAAKDIDLTEGAESALPPADAATPNRPTASGTSASSLVARILEKIRPQGSAISPEPQPGRVSPVQMRQLYRQVTQVRRSVQPGKLEHDPQLADSVMGLVSQIEMVTAQQCGAPKGADLALLLLANQAEDR
ncbi:MAG TPA: tetratricopeptide repeat protein [Terriglobales bacterium]|nr:tetratricopeptide repeat protein [Terriglobales bacterium]